MQDLTCIIVKYSYDIDFYVSTEETEQSYFTC
jgi:hypothetical protein